MKLHRFKRHDFDVLLNTSLSRHLNLGYEWTYQWHGYSWNKETYDQNAWLKSKNEMGIEDAPLTERDLETQCILNILASIEGTHFNIVEIGAGRADQCLAIAGCIAHKLIPSTAITYSCFAVEADPYHYQWAKRHIKAQDISGKVINFAVNNYDGMCTLDLMPFSIKKYINDNKIDALNFYGLLKNELLIDPALDYGQEISSSHNANAAIDIPCLTLRSIIRKSNFKYIDLLHVDVQGAEYYIFDGQIDMLKDSNVNYIFIGTHRRSDGIELHHNEINNHLRKLLCDDFELLIDVCPRSGITETPLGLVDIPFNSNDDGLMLFRKK